MSNEVLFDRKASFSFGFPGKLGRSYEGFRIRFKIIKTSESTPNKSNVQVYNLTRDSRALAEKKGQAFIISAGYQTTEEVLFSGDIARVITELEGPDYVTTFEAGDGEKSYREAKVDISFQEGVNLKDIFTQLATSLGKQIKDPSSIKSENIVNGMALSGLSRKHMDELTLRYGLEWSIQNGALQVLEKNKASKETAILLSVDSGLIGVPKKKDDGSIEVVSLLQPKIIPGRKIELDTKFISGTYRCQKVTQTGDTHGNDWYSQIEAIKV